MQSHRSENHRISVVVVSSEHAEHITLWPRFLHSTMSADVRPAVLPTSFRPALYFTSCRTPPTMHPFGNLAPQPGMSPPDPGLLTAVAFVPHGPFMSPPQAMYTSKRARVSIPAGSNQGTTTPMSWRERLVAFARLTWERWLPEPKKTRREAERVKGVQCGPDLSLIALRTLCRSTTSHIHP